MPGPVSDSLDETLEFAVALAREGGDFTLPFFYSDDLQVNRKADNSHVTEADRGAEKLMRQRIEARFPDDGIVGEEWGVKQGTSDRTWFLDPVDGTEVFVRNVPLYGTLVAVAQDGAPVADAGVIYMPAIPQIVFASRGRGAWTTRNVPSFESSPEMLTDVQKAQVSEVSDPAEAYALSSFDEWWLRTGRADVHHRFIESFGVHRGWGHCYAPLLVATGMSDVWVEPSAHDWDFGPVNLIIEEAGGAATTISGEHTFRGGNMVATNGKLHDHALAALKGF